MKEKEAVYEGDVLSLEVPNHILKNVEPLLKPHSVEIIAKNNKINTIKISPDLLDETLVKSLLSLFFDAKLNIDKNTVVTNINELKKHSKYSWKEVEHTTKHMYLYAIDIDLLEKLVLECSMPINKALMFASHCMVGDHTVLNKSAKPRYEQFLLSMFKMATEQKTEFDKNNLVEITGLSIQTLEELLEYQPKMSSILDEFFAQVNKTKITDDHREFIQRHKISIQGYIKQNSDSLDLEEILPLLKEEGVITNGDTLSLQGQLMEEFFE